MRGRSVLAIAAVAVIALGLFLRWPSLRSGYHTDDVVQLAMLRGDFPARRAFWDLYRFADVERDGTALMDAGYLPWWSQADLRIAMFRPVSSALLALDYAVFGENPRASHAHSLLWWVLVVAAAALLYSRVLPIPTAVLALCLFALDEGHSAPSFWIANRSTLVSVAFGLLGVWAHASRARSPSLRLGAFEAFAFSAAFFAGEYGIAFAAYALAYEWFERRSSDKETLRSLLPVAAPLAACIALRQLLGFGIRGSGYYVGPFEAPRRFITEAANRLPALWADAILGIPAQEWAALPEQRTSQLIYGVLSAAALILIARWLDSRKPRANGGVYWLAWGAVLSTLAAGGALPEDRLVLSASAGSLPVFAALVVEAARAVRERRLLVGAAGVAFAAGILAVHGAQAFTRTRDSVAGFLHGTAVQRAWCLGAEIPDAPQYTQRVIILNAADFTTAAHLPWVRRVAGHPLPHSYFRLGGSGHVHEIRRVDSRIIDVSVLSDDVDGSIAGSLYREAPVRRRQVVTLDGVRIEVIATARRNPWRTRFTFDRDLDDPSVVFLHSRPGGMQRYRPPAVGQKLRLASPALPH